MWVGWGKQLFPAIPVVSQEQKDLTKWVLRTEVRNLNRSIRETHTGGSSRWLLTYRPCVVCHRNSYIKGQELECSQGPNRCIMCKEDPEEVW